MKMTMTFILMISDDNYGDDDCNRDDVKFVQLWPGWVLEVTKQIPRKERWCFE